MKAIVLTGGKGERLKPITNRVSKCALKVNRKPLVCYSLDNCQRLFDERFIEEAIVVVGYKSEDIADAVQSCKYSMPVRFVTQQGESAIEAISSAKEYLHEDGFVLMLGDEIFIDPNQESMFKLLNADKYISGVIGYVQGIEEDILKTYTFDVNRIYVTRLIEKPTYIFNDMIGTGNCIIPYEFFEWTKHAKAKHVGDFVTVIQYGIDLGCSFGHMEIGSKYFNINDLKEYSSAIKYIVDGKE